MISHEPAVIYLSLGSNIEPEQNLNAAIKLLREHCDVLDVSPVFRTAPQGYTDQPDFLNMAVSVQTRLPMPPHEFKLRVIGRIERELGRVRDPNNKNAPRTIDLDIAFWNDEHFDYGDRPWQVPDPDILRFAHVAVPLAMMDPFFMHPVTGQTLAEIADSFDTSAMQRVFVALDEHYIVNIEGAIYRDGRYLLVIRGEAEDHAAGALAFVGGKVVAGPADSVLEATLRREIREEVNVDVSEIVYVCSKLFGDDPFVPVLNMVFLCRCDTGDPRIGDPGEVAEIVWLSASEILNHPACPPWLPAYLHEVEAKRAALGW